MRDFVPHFYAKGQILRVESKSSRDMFVIFLDCTVAFVRSSLLAIRRFDQDDYMYLKAPLNIPYPIGPPGVTSIETSILDLCTIVTLLASSCLFIRTGFQNFFDSVGCQRELHKWKRWGKSGQSKWSRSDPAQILLYFTVNAAMKTKRQLILLGIAQIIMAHIYLMMVYMIADPNFLQKEHEELLFLFAYTVSLAMGLKITWDLALRELKLILDMRVAWGWAASKLKDKSFYSKKVKLNSGSHENSLMFSLFDYDMDPKKLGLESTESSQGDVSGGYSSGEEKRKRLISRAAGGLYRAKMETLQRKSAACAALLNLFNIRPCSMPCGTFYPFSINAAEEKLSQISLDLATLEVSIIEGAQKQTLSQKGARAGASAANDMDAMDVASLGVLASRYIRQKNRGATFHMLVWVLNAVAVVGLSFAITSFFDPWILWHSLTGGREDIDKGIVTLVETHSLSQPLTASGMLIADVSLAIEALVIFSRYFGM